MIKCPACGAENISGATKCTTCGMMLVVGRAKASPHRGGYGIKPETLSYTPLKKDLNSIIPNLAFLKDEKMKSVHRHGAFRKIIIMILLIGIIYGGYWIYSGGYVDKAINYIRKDVYVKPFMDIHVRSADGLPVHINSGDSVKLISVEADAYIVEYNDKSVKINKNNLPVYISSTGFRKAEILSSVRYRDNPYGEILGRLDAGDKIRIHSYKNNYFEVYIDKLEKKAFVHKDYVNFLPIKK